MFPYVALYWSWVAIAFVARNRRHSLAWAAVFALLLVFFVGTRGQVGCDYAAYEQRFHFSYIGLDWMEDMFEGEGLFNWLNMALLKAGLSYPMLLLVCGALFVACTLRFSLLAQRPLSLLVLSFPVLVVQLAMSGLRQASATAFLMLAMVAFVEGRRWWVMAWIAVAALFHTSAIIFLPIAFLIGRRLSTLRMSLVVLALGPVVAYLLGSRLEVYNARYVQQIYGEQSSDGAWYRYALVLIPFIVMFWKQRIVEREFPQLYPLLRLFGLFTISLVVAGAISSVALHRFVFYVMPASILALLCISEAIFASNSRRIGSLLPFLAYGAYITVWFGFSSHGTSCFIPYENWLFGSGA